MKDALSVFKLRPVVSLFLAMLFITAATNIFNGSLLYYLSYIISNPKLLSAASFLGMLGALAAGLLVPKLSQRYGKTSVHYRFGIDFIMYAGISGHQSSLSRFRFMLLRGAICIRVDEYTAIQYFGR